MFGEKGELFLFSFDPDVDDSLFLIDFSMMNSRKGASRMIDVC
jgi:hypothetical protein